MKLKHTNLIFAAFCILLVGAVLLWQLSRPGEAIAFADHLDETVVTVDGTAYPLRELAFYIAYEEYIVEEEAKVYSPEDTNTYWNLHTNGEFIKISAKKAAMDMAVHDLIFYALAEKGNLTLTDEEKETLAMKQEDFWYDLSDHQREVLSGLKDELDASMERIALAQKQQGISAAVANASYEEYNMGGTKYLQLLQAHSYEVSEDIWEHLNFGNVTLSH